MRSMLPRKFASVFVRAPVMRRSFGVLGRHRFSEVNPRLAHLFMICSNIKLTWPEESIVSGVYVFHEQSQWDRRNLWRPARIKASTRDSDIRSGEPENAMATAPQPQNPARGSRMAAAPVISGKTRPRPCSAKARKLPGSCWSASSPATRKTSPASHSWDRRGRCSIARCKKPASTAGKSTSPMR